VHVWCTIRGALGAAVDAPAVEHRETGYEMVWLGDVGVWSTAGRKGSLMVPMVREGSFRSMLALPTLFRLLFPSWAFFDRAGDPPVLEMRAFSSNTPAEEWQPVVQAPPRRWWHLLFNPHGTLALAEQTLVERWHAELEDGAETEVTRALVERLVAASARDIVTSTTDTKRQYRLRIHSALPVLPDGSNDDRDCAVLVLRSVQP
jgi:hypothetical protein